MKLILFDFLCAEHGLFEELVKPEIHQAPCPKCGSSAQRQISAVRIDKTGMALQDGATPTSIDHFERVHRERRRIEEKTYREHGDYGPSAGAGITGPVTPDIASHLG
jgi:putative FmdB family regulatory protein